MVATTNGTVTVSGGTVQGVLAHEAASANATITGGTIEYTVGCRNDATLTITGGEFV